MRLLCPALPRHRSLPGTAPSAGQMKIGPSPSSRTSDGGYILAGYTRSYGAGGYDAWLIKTDVEGDTLWTRTFGGSDTDVGRSVRQTSDGGVFVCQ